MSRRLRSWLERLEDRAVPATVSGTFANVSTLSGGSTDTHLLQVSYAADVGEKIDTATLGSGDLLATGPGYSQSASFVSFSDPNGDQTLIVGKYSIPANALGSAFWDHADNGEYTVALQSGAVKTIAGLDIAAGPVNAFQVAVGKDYFVTSVADDGPGSLRATLALAKTDIAMDTLRFDPSVFATKQTILLASELVIDTEVIIVGPTAKVVLDQTLADTRALSVSDADTTAISAIVSNLIVVGSGGSGVNGGGILVGEADSLALTDCEITGNTGSAGGGIHVAQNGRLALSKSNVSGNSATGAGGGVYFFNNGALLVGDSSVTGNVANGSAGGGGVYFFGSAEPGQLRIVNSTISSNSAPVGGGIALRSGTPTTQLQVFNSTISANKASAGGGLARPSGNGTAALVSTLLSGNTAGEDADLALPGTDTLTVTYSALGQGLGTEWEPLYTAEPTNLPFASDLKLQALARTGSTMSHALGPASPAREKGANPLNLAVDQTGGPRVQIAGVGVIDIGAFERIPGQPIATAGTLANVVANLAGTNNPYAFTITYADDTAISKLTVGDAAEIVVTRLGGGFTANATFVSVTPNLDASTLVATYSFTPPGGTWDGTDNGKYSVELLPNAVQNSVGTAIAGGPLGSFTVGVPSHFVVTNANDSGSGSLRQAILDANAVLEVADTIGFDPAFFATARNITLTSQLSITDAVAITGPGASLLTLTGSGSRLIQIDGLNRIGVSLSGVTLTGGTATGSGGAILFDDELVTLQNCILEANTASTDGGAISMTDVGSLTIIASTLRNNRASTDDGGAINMGGAGRLVIRQSTLSGNSAAGEGGGAYFFTGGSLLLDSSTLSGNTAAGTLGGGGLYFFGAVDGEDFTVVNSTISGNSAAGQGGGILFRNLATTLGVAVIQNSTVAFNSGGGVASTGSSGSIAITSTIVAGNLAANDLTGDIEVAFSAIGSGSYTDAGNNLAPGFNLNLGILALNGGPTATHLPGSGSAALGKGSNPSLQTLDQRGLIREDGAIDIGAVEVQLSGPPAVSGFTINTGSAQRSRLTTITLNFAGSVTPAQFNATGAITLTRTLIGTNGLGTIGTVVQTGASGANGLIAVGQGSATSLVITFSNADGASTSAGVEHASLADGRWRLAVPASGYLSALNDTALRRLFGDVNNDGTIDGATDFASFGAAFGTTPGLGVNPFDFNNDGTVDGTTDFANFGTRFGVTL